MYDEYVDRVTEVVTGIVQQAGDRNNVLVDLGKVEALLPRSEQVDGERYEQGSRIKAVITEVRSGHEGPAGDPLAPRPGADPDAVRARGAGDRRRPGRDPRGRARAGLPLEDRRRVARPGRRPGRRLRRALAARACAWSSRSCAARRSTSSRGTRSRRASWPRRSRPARVREVYLDDDGEGGDGRHPRRPARAGDRQGGHERPPRRAPDRLEGRHQVRHRVRDRGGGGRLRRRRRRGRHRVHRPLRRGALDAASAARTRPCPGSRYCGVPAHQELAGSRRRGAGASEEPVVAEAAEAGARGRGRARRSRRPRASAPTASRSRRPRARGGGAGREAAPEPEVAEAAPSRGGRAAA